MSPERRDELATLLEKVFALPAVRELEPDRRLLRIHYDWLDAGEITQRNVARVSAQLRRYLDDQAWLETAASCSSFAASNTTRSRSAMRTPKGRGSILTTARPQSSFPSNGHCSRRRTRRGSPTSIVVQRVTRTRPGRWALRSVAFVDKAELRRPHSQGPANARTQVSLAEHHRGASARAGACRARCIHECCVGRWPGRSSTTPEANAGV